MTIPAMFSTRSTKPASGWGGLLKRNEKEGVRTKATALARLITDASKPVTDIKAESAVDGQQSGTADISQVTAAAKELIEALRSWYERADDTT
jgi:hypothetical protein